MNNAIGEAKADKYGYKRVVDLPFSEAVSRLKDALKDEGFGVLTEIDLKAKFKEKLDKDFGEYLILGACNPSFAYDALEKDIDLGLLLPCNAVVYENDGKTVVALIDAEKMLSVTGNTELTDLAGEVNAKLERALSSV
jgi:uncharacterized protein (DUF302 family)